MKNRMRIILWIFVTLIIMLFLFHNLFKLNTQTSKTSLEYKIKPGDIEKKSLDVNIRIYSTEMTQFLLAKGSIDILSSRCVDQKGRQIPFDDAEGIIAIGPISEDVEYIDYSYSTILGEVEGDRVKGDLYEDLMVFSGEDTLLFPFFDNTEALDNLDKYISKIAIEVETQEGWNSVMPFQANINQDNKVFIDNPDWYVFYNLAKSCYAFGRFEPLTIRTIDGTYDFFVDTAYKQKLTSENVKAMTNIYNYYTQIFGKGLSDYAVVLLRNEPTRGFPILGGVGGKSLGISLDMKTGIDWYTFSHTLYHAFFDSKIHARNLHFPPNLWLYKGLAEHYVDKSAATIPLGIREKCEIIVDENLDSTYARYLYFLEEELMSKVTPAYEADIEGIQREYYYNIKVPLVINEIEDMAQKRHGTQHNLIGVLMKYAEEGNVNLANIMTEVLGSDEAIVRAYLAEEDVIPYSGDNAILSKARSDIMNSKK